MSAVRSRGNKTTEVRLRGALIAAGVSGWKVCHVGVPGTPDFAFPRQHLAVFVDGCFWHACGRCKKGLNKLNAYWANKLRNNRLRDARQARQLRSQGWQTMRLWEHEVRRDPAKCANRIRARLAFTK